MLVLARRKSQRVLIGADIFVEVLNVRRDGVVRLGITAPKDVTVHREEVVIRMSQADADAIRRANGNHRDGGIEP